MYIYSGTKYINEGCRLGNLAMKIFGTFNNRNFLARVYGIYYFIVHCYTNPIQNSIEPLMYGHRVGLETGDIEFAVVCIYTYMLCFNWV